MSKKIKAGIIGANGYAGAELTRLLLAHPGAEISGISSRSEEGRQISDIYNSYRELCGLRFTGAQELYRKCDVIFASVPHGVSEEYAAKAVDAGVVFIDLGADFRLDDPADYKEWYGLSYSDMRLHKMCCYGLTEVNRERIKKCDIIGNPGCYPTGIALSLYPALEGGFIENRIIIDSKSGVTGAGRELSRKTHFAECSGAFGPYKVAAHRHTPEIEQSLTAAAGQDVTVTFVPHLLPVNRGIISTCYAKLRPGVSFGDIKKSYEKRYSGEFFVRLMRDGECADISSVKYSNFCDISLHFDARTDTFIAVSAIDNMVKGAAGQAVQNMNVRFGLAEDTGLRAVPPAF